MGMDHTGLFPHQQILRTAALRLTTTPQSTLFTGRGLSPLLWDSKLCLFLTMWTIWGAPGTRWGLWEVVENTSTGLWADILNKFNVISSAKGGYGECQWGGRWLLWFKWHPKFLKCFGTSHKYLFMVSFSCVVIAFKMKMLRASEVILGHKIQASLLRWQFVYDGPTIYSIAKKQTSSRLPLSSGPRQPNQD